MTPRLIPTYLTWKVPVPKTIAEDLESKHKGAGKLQGSWMHVQQQTFGSKRPCKRKKESQQKKREQDAQKKAEAEEAVRVAEEVARKEDSQRMNEELSCVIFIWRSSSDSS